MQGPFVAWHPEVRPLVLSDATRHMHHNIYTMRCRYALSNATFGGSVQARETFEAHARSLTPCRQVPNITPMPSFGHGTSF